MEEMEEQKEMEKKLSLTQKHGTGGELAWTAFFLAFFLGAAMAVGQDGLLPGLLPVAVGQAGVGS
jgi:hypothetical protein